MRLPFIYRVKQTRMRYPAHTTNAANEQQSRSPFGLMIRLLLVLLLLLFHARATAGGGNPPSISLAGILSAYTEGDGTKTPASDVTITAGDSGSPNFTATEIQSASVFINVGYQWRGRLTRVNTQPNNTNTDGDGLTDREIATRRLSRYRHRQRMERKSIANPTIPTQMVMD